MSENDEWTTVETVDEGGDPLSNGILGGTDSIDNGVFTKILSAITSTNPWLLFLIGIASYYLVQRIRAQSPRSSPTPENLNPDEILARQEAVEVARRKMQEQYDQKAREYAAKQKEKEELARQEKLKNLEKYGTKLGRSSKTLAAESATADEAQANLFKKKPVKSSLRPEYNPLMGGGGSGVCFRPTRRGGGAGGG